MKKKILFFFHDGGITGATLSLHRLMINSSVFDEYDVHVYMPDEKSYLFSKMEPYNVTIHTFPRISSKKGKFLQLTIYYSKLFNLFRKIRPSILYANTILSFESVIIAKILAFKVLLHVHEGKIVLNKFNLRVKILSLLVDRIIFVSKNSFKSFDDISISQLKSNVIYNTLDFYPNISNDLRCLQNDIVKISVIGTITKNKSQLSVIKALRNINENLKNKNVILNIFGNVQDDLYYDKLNEFIQHHNLCGNVFFHGEVKDINEIYAETDIVIVASKDESFGMVTIESFAFKKPVISTDNSGSLELIKDNYNGLIYPYGDISCLQKKILFLIENEKDCQRLVDNAFSMFKLNFNIEKIIYNWEITIRKT